jgi:hypothetical protein
LSEARKPQLLVLVKKKPQPNAVFSAEGTTNGEEPMTWAVPTATYSLLTKSTLLSVKYPPKSTQFGVKIRATCMVTA